MTDATLKILPCPLCSGPVSVKDCGYTTFNPGYAECDPCDRKWEVGYVDDIADATRKWNRWQPFVIEVDQLRARLQEIKKIVDRRSD